jgi:NAD(P)-dependent dehydrogenase (short-subunit alcohol dehydrogenase family)
MAKAHTPGQLSQKAAIVTGGASGIGNAIATRFVREGASVTIADLDLDKASAAAKEISDQLQGQCIGVGCDVGEKTQVQNCVRETLARFGGLDIVINNAGLMSFKGLADWTAEDWLRLLRVDLLGAAFFTAEAFRHMRAGGSIVNVASVHAVMTSPNVAPYAAAKAALLSLTRSAAIEGRSRCIRANAILPGAIDTPMLRENPNIKSGAEVLDPEDIGSPDDIAGAALFLASDDAKFITGTSLVVDGGRLARL